MQKNRLILHIGLPKTGSTSIQRFLGGNGDALKRLGFVNMKSHGFLWEPFPPYDGWEKKRKTLEEELPDIRKRLEKYNVIYSSEALTFMLLSDPGRLSEIKEYIGDNELEVLVYLRRQDVHFESLYREILKQHDIPTPPTADYFKEHFQLDLYDYASMLETFEQHVGAGNIKVRVFERKRLVGGDVVKDFCEAVGIPDDKSLVVNESEINPSVDARLCDYFAVANRQWPVHNDAGHHFNDILIIGSRHLFPQAEAKFLDLEVRKRLLENYRDSNSRVAAKYFGSEDSELFVPLDEGKFGDIGQFSHEDHARLALFLHETWRDGLGAIPFSIYNYGKIKYLKEMKGRAKGFKRLSLQIRIAFHGLLHLLVGNRLKRGDKDIDSVVREREFYYLLRFLRKGRFKNLTANDA